MPTSDDREDRLGSLAVALGFVTRAQLDRAREAGPSVGPGACLGGRLVDLGALTQRRRSLLEAMVDEQLGATGGDPAIRDGESPVEESASDRGETIAGRSGVLPGPETVPVGATTVRGDGAGFATSTAWGATSPWQPDPIAGRPPGGLGGDGGASSAGEPGRYRVIRPLAEGGLGVLSVAVDTQLDRHVALKELRGRYADRADSRARFLLEAEVTGKLEHPGILPVYGLGASIDGRAYYAMRLVHGESLRQAIARFHGPEGPGYRSTAWSLRLRELLGRLVDVCNAIAYAHSRGVIHRDLKPANVMLGPFGEALVVDWGLAKVLGRHAGCPAGPDEASAPVQLSATVGDAFEATRADAVVGTPAYMSPEQAEGRVDDLGPGTDVYGLGAILYAILTGRGPVEGSTDLAETLDRVRLGRIPTPRQVDPRLPRALDAICCKAMAVRPEGRYGSAMAMADDLARWLADEPVSAWREPSIRRLGRRIRKHRVASGVVLAALSCVASSVVVAAILLDRERERSRAIGLASRSHELTIETLSEILAVLGDPDAPLPDPSGPAPPPPAVSAVPGPRGGRETGPAHIPTPIVPGVTGQAPAAGPLAGPGSPEQRLRDAILRFRERGDHRLADRVEAILRRYERRRSSSLSNLAASGSFSNPQIFGD